MKKCDLISLDMSGSNIGIAYLRDGAPFEIDHIEVGKKQIERYCLVEFDKIKEQMYKLAYRARTIYNYVMDTISLTLGSEDSFVPVLAWEVPRGGRSMNIKATFGMVSGIIGCIYDSQRFGVLTGVTVEEAKSMVIPGAGKEDILDWYVNKYPNLRWQKTSTGTILKKNEHCADAIAIAEAALYDAEVQLRLKYF